MKRGTFPASCYGRAGGSLRLRQPVPVLRAVLRDMRRIRCGSLHIEDANPIIALCRALRDSGRPDCGLLVTWHDRTPAAFVASFKASAC